MSKMSHSLPKRTLAAGRRLAVAFAQVAVLPGSAGIRTTVRAGALLIALLTVASIRPAVLEQLQLETEAGAVGVCPRTDPNYPTCRPPTDCATRATVSLSASPPEIRKGDSATVKWSVSLPSNCRRLTVTLNGQNVATQGSTVVTPLATGRYSLKLGAVTLANATVTVGLPRRVRIDGSTWEWRRLLIQAVGTNDTTVVLRHDVDMDLTGEANIAFGRNVTLMSEAPQVADLGLRSGVRSASWFARDARHLGPRLYTLGHPEKLFYIKCNERGDGENARLLGFRLQGPSLGRKDDDPAGGVMVHKCGSAEIAHMEISGWAGWGIAVRTSAARGIRIYDNFIHHNENKGAPGYGIDVQDGGYALIERNVFDFNRHAIDASGDPGTSYNANHNLVLRGGGEHGSPLNRFTHQFDVHGDDHCAGPIPIEYAPVVAIPVLPVLVPGYPVVDHDIPVLDTPIDAVYNCGNAGSEFVFTNNAFQYRRDRAIKLRGKPREGAYIYDNVFAHDDLDDAVAPLDDLDVHVPKARNTVRADTYGQYGVCDFDGDGKDDLFLPTGANWWYSSAGRMHWTFLAPHTERLTQVGLGDFTGDGRCDVFAVRYGQWAISDGGTGDWQLIPGDYTDFPFDRLAFADFNGDRRKDIFHRAENGQWSVISPGVHDWRDLARSSILLNGLRFGDFDADGVADVLSRSGGVWSVSWSGETDWQPLPSGLTDSLTSLLIANVDGIPGDDMVRFVVIDRHHARWEISSGGATRWQTFATMEWPMLPVHGPLSQTVFSFVGNFDNLRGADLLMVDSFRMSRLRRNTDQTFRPHGLYAY